ncbi:hypothetical protein EDM68_05115 [Candidatus Uhrbacteria bacterium]|nr:MAG: hypothetical protein EDM68_05115 [Candidatus Uhrbacteria bacterium]
MTGESDAIALVRRETDTSKGGRMSLNVPSEITARVANATTEIVDHETFVGICKASLPGAVKMYERLRARLDATGEDACKKCFHGFTDEERGHVIRACYGDAINRELNAHFGLVLVRVAPGRVAGFTPAASSARDFRDRVFAHSAQRAHEDDAVETPAIIDHPDTLREIERVYPLAFACIASHYGRPFAHRATEQPLFGQLVEMLSIRPYRFLLEDAFGPIATVNCCRQIGGGKKEGEKPKEETPRQKSDDTMGDMSWDFLVSRTHQFQMQEPYLLDC